MMKQSGTTAKARESACAATRGRVLDAAARVFAREGLSGATTREIADEARVNEVTLFRHFKNKQGLLAAVIEHYFSTKALDAVGTKAGDGGNGAGTTTELPKHTDSLEHDLTAFARYYHRLLNSNVPLLRTVVGEIHHYASHEGGVLAAIFRPARVFLAERFESERKAGRLGLGIAPELLSDIFTSMIFTGVLRCSSPHFKRNYSPAAYLKGVVEFTLRATVS